MPARCTEGGIKPDHHPRRRVCRTTGGGPVGCRLVINGERKNDHGRRSSPEVSGTPEVVSELRRLDGGAPEWNEPRLFRLRQLAALFRAFGVPWDPPSFAEGNRISDILDDALLAKLAIEMGEELRDGHAPNRHQLPEFFAILFSYRERIDQAPFSSGVMEASGLYLQAHRVAAKLNRLIQDNISIIEDILAALISPEAVEFSVEQLARDHGYPDVDLGDIDEEWW